MTIRQGHIDRPSEQPCGWANGTMDCSVSGCQFPEERCILVKRERDAQAARYAAKDAGHDAA